MKEKERSQAIVLPGGRICPRDNISIAYNVLYFLATGYILLTSGYWVADEVA
jgi:hypothetical protein